MVSFILSSKYEGFSEETKKSWNELRSFINSTPEVMSLLYDLDLLPEQIMTENKWTEMIIIVEHFRFLYKRLTKEA